MASLKWSGFVYPPCNISCESIVPEFQIASSHESNDSQERLFCR